MIPRKLREYWLLIASYYFYMGWNAKYALSDRLIDSDHICKRTALRPGRIIPKRNVPEKIQKKLVLAACMAVNLGILAVFKYGNFAINSVNYILSKNSCLGGGAPV